MAVACKPCTSSKEIVNVGLDLCVFSSNLIRDVSEFLQLHAARLVSAGGEVKRKGKPNCDPNPTSAGEISIDQLTTATCSHLVGRPRTSICFATRLRTQCGRYS